MLTRYDELEIENAALRAEVDHLRRELQAAYDDAYRVASEAKQEARESVWQMRQQVIALLDAAVDPG